MRDYRAVRNGIIAACRIKQNSDRAYRRKIFTSRVLAATLSGQMKGPVALIVAGLLGGIGAAAGDVVKAPTAVETPLVITTGYGVDGLVLWLAADSGVTMDSNGNVSALADKTGNFTLTAGSPDDEPAIISKGLNGRPVLRFNPDQSLYSADEFGTALDRDMTIIVLAKTNASRTFFQYPLYLGQNHTSHANRALAYYQGKEIFDGQWVSFYGPPVVRNAFVMMGVSVNPTVTQAAFYQNGAPTMVSNLSDENGKAAFENLSSGITLGAATQPCRGWLGDIAEVLVYDRQLSSVEMQMIWSALSIKYGLQTQAVAPSSTSPD